MPKKPKLTDEQIRLLGWKTSALDFNWWYRRCKITVARQQLEAASDLPVSVRLFKKLRDEYCNWYGKAKRPGPSHKTTLSEEEWQLLRKQVSQCERIIEGCTLDEAVAIMCTIIPCNRTVLLGLRKDLHYWKSE
jgi:hypothetical protein